MSESDRVIDPVCGMTITTAQAPFDATLAGATYFFCSQECRLKFDLDGEAYAAAARLGLPNWGMTPHPPAIIEQFRRPAM